LTCATGLTDLSGKIPGATGLRKRSGGLLHHLLLLLERHA
jgi:hypothetical protein